MSASFAKEAVTTRAWRSPRAAAIRRNAIGMTCSKAQRAVRRARVSVATTETLPTGRSWRHAGRGAGPDAAAGYGSRVTDRRLALTCGALLAAVGLGACGSPQDGAATDAAQQFERAVADDPAAACARSRR